MWLLVTGAGAWILSNYENKSGESGASPTQWPTDASVQQSQGRPVLLMFAHPQCPCTRASVEELNRIMAWCSGKLDAHVYFILPDNMPKEWTKTSLWQTTATIPGVKNHLDLRGDEAKRFGAESSGFVVLYGATGKLLFHGGITAARGHMGDNAGENAIISLVQGRSVELASTSVFGCGLSDEETVPSILQK